MKRSRWMELWVRRSRVLCASTGSLGRIVLRETEAPLPSNYTCALTTSSPFWGDGALDWETWILSLSSAMFEVGVREDLCVVERRKNQEAQGSCRIAGATRRGLD